MDPFKLREKQRIEVVREAYLQGLETNRFHLESADVLARETGTALGLFTTAGFGALGYTAHLLEVGKPAPMAVAVGAVAAYMLILAAIMTRKCASAADIFPSTNEPNNLISDGYTWQEIMAEDAKNLNVRIEFNRSRNKKVGVWLNKLRYLSFASPIIFVVAWKVAAAAGWGTVF